MPFVADAYLLGLYITVVWSSHVKLHERQSVQRPQSLRDTESQLSA